MKTATKQGTPRTHRCARVASRLAPGRAELSRFAASTKFANTVWRQRYGGWQSLHKPWEAHHACVRAVLNLRMITFELVVNSLANVVEKAGTARALHADAKLRCEKARQKTNLDRVVKNVEA